jgi:hypothetical protein
MLTIKILLIINIVALIVMYIKIKTLFKLKIIEEDDGSYSLKYDNKEIYNAKPK